MCSSSQHPRLGLELDARQRRAQEQVRVGDARVHELAADGEQLAELHGARLVGAAREGVALLDLRQAALLEVIDRRDKPLVRFESGADLGGDRRFGGLSFNPRDLPAVPAPSLRSPWP
jgi:hypothetical protein